MTIKQVLQNVYRSSGQRALVDDEYFIEQLARYYEPSMKRDCQLLERGIRCGAGKIIVQFLRQNAVPTIDENITFRSTLQRRAGFTQPEAETIMGLLYHMVSFPVPKYTKTQPSSQKKKFDFSSLLSIPMLHLLLSLVYAIVIGVSILQVANGNDFSDPYATLTDIAGGFLAGKLFGPNLGMMILGVIFSAVGVFIKQPWPYLVSAIIQTIGAFMVIGVAFIQPIPLIANLLIAALGYVSFYLVNKQKK